jgi:hypothetical protein
MVWWIILIKQNDDRLKQKPAEYKHLIAMAFERGDKK